jgi:beta-glucosidase
VSARAFPAGFEWGSATAAHQIEGGNWNNDWWQWEHAPGTACIEPSGDACDSWNRWPDDVAIARDLGLTSYRFSIEWSRIEPEEGEWSHAAIEHYLALGHALLAAGIEPVVTFHHFSSPRWFADRGGWLRADAPDGFGRFCARAARELAPILRRACTINEPNIVAVMGYLLGMFPPGHTDLDEFHAVSEVFCRAHRVAVDAIRAAAPGVPVGMTLSMTEHQAVDGGEAMLEQTQRMMEDVFLDATAGDDFFGVQTYSRMRVGASGPVGPEEGAIVLPMGYEFWPQALAATIRRAWAYTGGKIPLLVTENGIGTDDDALRVRYLETALDGVLDCLADGIDVRGYTYWSLLDNFEWAFGYVPRFGLVEVDRTTFARTPKPSAARYAEIIRTNTL